MLTTKADNFQRVVVPQAKPGQLYAIQDNLDGSFTLKAIRAEEPESPTCRLGDEDGFPIAVPNQPINEDVIKELLSEFP